MLESRRAAWLRPLNGVRLWKWGPARGRNRRSELFTFDDLSVITVELLFKQGLAPEYSLLSSSVSTADCSVGTCVICLSDVEKGDRFIQLGCSHRFHWNCLTPWLDDHSQCPTCRNEIELPWGWTNGLLSR